MLSGDAADNAMQRLPQIQAHPTAQHALAHIPCHMLGELQALITAVSGRVPVPEAYAPDWGTPRHTAILEDGAARSSL